MAISHELILELSDLDIISIQCKTCDTRILLSLEKHAEVPSRCPSCDDEWENIRHAVQQYSATLKSLEQFNVTFHVPKPAAGV